ncbi:MAG: hypothetical protein H7Z75_22230 [Ferruginibacter sp.]|nr:hypothetical protein [Cytophagales bacterium]
MPSGIEPLKVNGLTISDCPVITLVRELAKGGCNTQQRKAILSIKNLFMLTIALLAAGAAFFWLFFQSVDFFENV